MLLAVSTCEETITIWYLMGILITIVKLIVPLIVIIFGIVDVTTYITKDPSKETRVLLSKIFKRLAAAIIIFMVPTLITNIIEILTNQKIKDNKCTICLNKPNEEKCQQYLQEAKDRKEQEKLETEEITVDGNLDTSSLSEGKRRGKNGELDFSYEGDGTVKSQFSSDTLKIVEDHLYDLNYENFNEVIASYGGFDNYVKKLGGVFEEFYGKDISVETEYEYQRVAEYVFGFLYMYGTDYCSGERYFNWGAGLGESGHSDDAFYSGNYRTPYCTPEFSTEFDDVVAGKGTHSDLIISAECGPVAWAVLYKSGIWPKNEDRKPFFKTRRLNELRPGDLIRFFETPSSSTDHANHVAIVGEVYDDRVVIYDGGSHFQLTRNFKREVKITDTQEGDYAEIQKEFSLGSFQAERFYELERSS